MISLKNRAKSYGSPIETFGNNTKIDFDKTTHICNFSDEDISSIFKTGKILKKHWKLYNLLVMDLFFSVCKICIKQFYITKIFNLDLISGSKVCIWIGFSRASRSVVLNWAAAAPLGALKNSKVTANFCWLINYNRGCCQNVL